MFHSIASFDIQQALTTYAPYTARKIVIRLSNMDSIEQPFNITINYRDAITNDPFSEVYAVSNFPAFMVFQTNHTGNIILDSIESDYTGSGTCTAYMWEYEYTAGEDTTYSITKNYIATDSSGMTSPYFMPYSKGNNFGILLRYYGGTTGDVIRVTVRGLTNGGERIEEICYVRDTDDYIRLSGDYFVLTSIIYDKLSSNPTSGQLEIKTNGNIETGNIYTQGTWDILSNVGNTMSIGYSLSNPSRELLFIGVYNNGNTANEAINYVGNTSGGSFSDSMTVRPGNYDSEVKILWAPELTFLDNIYIGSFASGSGTLQWGIIQLPAPIVPNNYPYTYAGIPNQTYPVDTNNYLNLEIPGQQAFIDPDNDALTYSVISESNYNDTSFIYISGNQIVITPSNVQANKTFNFTIRATDGGGLYAETAFNVEVTGGSQQDVDRFIGNLTTNLVAFIIEETPTHYKAIGWFDMGSLSLQTLIEPTIELTGANVIMSKDYIAQHPSEFTVQEFN